MKIKKITWQMGNDYSADMECEHCGRIGRDESGYMDNFYMTRVIPAMHCKGCGRNRAGNLEHTDAAVSPVVA